MSPNSASGGTDESIDKYLGFERRPLLKALGAGAALSLGGSAVATAGDDSESEDGEDDSEQIDPVFGYPTTDAEDIPDELDPDHEVELLVAPPSGPGQPPFLYFEPIGLHVESGDIVQFTARSPDHTVTATHPDIGPDRRVPEEAEPFSSPVIGPGSAWLYRFEHEGVYDLYCGPHLILGMVMRIVVGDLAEEDVPEYATTVEGLPSAEDFSEGLNQMSEQNEDCEWPFLMPAAVFGADSLDPMCIQDAGEVSFSSVAEDLGYEFQAPEEQPEHGGDEENATAEGEGNATEEAEGNATAEEDGDATGTDNATGGDTDGDDY